MHTREVELHLFDQVWRKRIAGLTRKLEETSPGRTGLTPTFEECNAQSGLHAQIAVYKLCLDWSLSETEALAGRWSEDRPRARERFYHLMAILAKMEIACEENTPTYDLMSAGNDEPPTREVQWLELLAATSSILDHLAEPVHAPRHA